MNNENKGCGKCIFHTIDRQDGGNGCIYPVYICKSPYMEENRKEIDPISGGRIKVKNKLECKHLNYDLMCPSFDESKDYNTAYEMWKNIITLKIVLKKEPFSDNNTTIKEIKDKLKSLTKENN